MASQTAPGVVIVFPHGANPPAESGIIMHVDQARAEAIQRQKDGQSVFVDGVRASPDAIGPNTEWICSIDEDHPIGERTRRACVAYPVEVEYGCSHRLEKALDRVELGKLHGDARVDGTHVNLSAEEGAPHAHYPEIHLMKYATVEEVGNPVTLKQVKVRVQTNCSRCVKEAQLQLLRDAEATASNRPYLVTISDTTAYSEIEMSFLELFRYASDGGHWVFIDDRLVETSVITPLDLDTATSIRIMPGICGCCCAPVTALP